MQDIGKYHQLKIARRTMELSCVGALILGGMDHTDAARLLGRGIPDDCTCQIRQQAAVKDTFR